MLSDLRALVALTLLGVSVPCLAQAYARAYRVFTNAGAPSDPAPPRWALAAPIALAAVVRWLIAPRWIVTMYIGYLLTEQAIELSTASHYGVGSLALYHALFGVLPHDHRSLLWVNAVVGVLTLPLSAAFAARLLRSRLAGVVFAFLVALVPLFVKNDDSDANHVPCLWWLFGGLVLWEAYLDDGGRPALAAATALLAAAAGARPEMPILLPALVVILTVGLAPPLARLRDPALLLAAVAAALLVLPHVLHVMGAASLLEEGGGLPGSDQGLWHLARLLLVRDTVLTPSLYPAALPILALAGLFLPPRAEGRAARLPRIALAVAAVVALGVYGLDLCRANMARVHVPGALFVTMLAAAGITALWARVPGRLVRVATVVVVAAAAVPTARTLWAPTNEQAEEDFLRRALPLLPGSPYTLVRFAREDRDRASPASAATHHHFPDYLIRPPMGVGRVSSIADYRDRPDRERPSFFYLGMRCYAEFRPEGTPPPHGDGLQHACAEMRASFTLEPVIEQEVPNRGDVWLEYYGDAPRLKLGLYRIRPRQGSP